MSKEPTTEAPEEKYDALLHHTAERLASFLGLRYEDASKVADGLKLIREELAIWTMVPLSLGLQLLNSVDPVANHRPCPIR